jgi:hypothetical protein
MNYLKFAAACALMLSTAAFADTVQVRLNHGADLPSCGGLIRSSASRGSGLNDQLNIKLDSIQNCSNLYVYSTGKSYKIPGRNGSRTGSFTLPASTLDYGWNNVRVAVYSDSQKHLDDIYIQVYVEPRTY